MTTNKRDSTLKVKKGPFVNGEGEQELFIIRGNEALRVPVKIGIMNFNEVEIAAGVSAGDEVIISDMAEYKHLSQIKIH